VRATAVSAVRCWRRSHREAAFCDRAAHGAVAHLPRV